MFAHAVLLDLGFCCVSLDGQGMWMTSQNIFFLPCWGWMDELFDE
jgi:hypothetical protein